MEWFELWIQTLGQSLGQFRLILHSEMLVSLDDLVNDTQGCTEVNPLTNTLKLGQGICDLLSILGFLYKNVTSEEVSFHDWKSKWMDTIETMKVYEFNKHLPLSFFAVANGCTMSIAFLTVSISLF